MTSIYVLNGIHGLELFVHVCILYIYVNYFTISASTRNINRFTAMYSKNNANNLPETKRGPSFDLAVTFINEICHLNICSCFFIEQAMLKLNHPY